MKTITYRSAKIKAYLLLVYLVIGMLILFVSQASAQHSSRGYGQNKKHYNNEEYHTSVEVRPHAYAYNNEPRCKGNHHVRKNKMVWIEGHWVWDPQLHQNVWVEGRWVKVQPQKVWIGGQWRPAPGGRVWVPGHWELI